MLNALYLQAFVFLRSLFGQFIIYMKSNLKKKKKKAVDTHNILFENYVGASPYRLGSALMLNLRICLGGRFEVSLRGGKWLIILSCSFRICILVLNDIKVILHTIVFSPFTCLNTNVTISNNFVDDSTRNISSRASSSIHWR